MLLRILFTYKPTCLSELGRKRKERKKKYRKENESKFAEDLAGTSKYSNNTVKRDPQQKALHKSETEVNTFSIECTSEEAMAIENDRNEERRQKYKPKQEVLIKASKLV